MSLKTRLVAVCIAVAAGLGVWGANAALTQVTLVTTIDENNPAATSTPVGKDCPVGVPCKLLSVVSVADSNQPMDSLTSISTGAFQGPIGPSIPNGTLVGNTRITGKYSLNGHCTDLIKPSIDESADFHDGGVKGEVADDPSDTALGDPTVWPTRLESDLRVAYLRSTGHQIARRSVAVITIDLPDPFSDITMPVNLLAFNVADGNGFAGLTLRGSYNVAVAGDPTTPSSSALCTPSTSSGLLLGQSAAGLTLNACQWSGTQLMTSVLTHDASGAIVVDATAYDAVTCSSAVGGLAEAPAESGTPAGHDSTSTMALAMAAMTGGLLLVVTGGWYVRRRWVH